MTTPSTYRSLITATGRRGRVLTYAYLGLVPSALAFVLYYLTSRIFTAGVSFGACVGFSLSVTLLWPWLAANLMTQGSARRAAYWRAGGLVLIGATIGVGMVWLLDH